MVSSFPSMLISMAWCCFYCFYFFCAFSGIITSHECIWCICSNIETMSICDVFKSFAHYLDDAVGFDLLVLCINMFPIKTTFPSIVISLHTDSKLSFVKSSWNTFLTDVGMRVATPKPLFLFLFIYFLNWDSLHARLNSHYETWSYKKSMKKITGYRKSI